MSPQPRTPAWTLINNKWVRATYVSPVYVYKRNGKLAEKKQRKLVDGQWVNTKVPQVEAGFHTLRLADNTVVKADARYTLLYRRYDKAIIQFKERNAVIREWVNYYANQNKWNTLVVATRTPHVLILQTILQPDLGDRLRVLTGDATTNQRDKAFAWFKATPGAVLISSVIKEGVSINEIKAGVIADPVVDPEVMQQIIGRFIRRKEDNHAYITWIVDRQHPKYWRNALHLIGQLEKEKGYRFYYPVNSPSELLKQPELFTL